VIHHIVLFRFAEGASSTQIAAAGEALRAMRDTIPDVRGVTFGPNLGATSREWSHVLVVEVDDMAAVGRYAVHPVHVDVVQRHIAPIREARLAVDVEC